MSPLTELLNEGTDISSIGRIVHETLTDAERELADALGQTSIKEMKPTIDPATILLHFSMIFPSIKKPHSYDDKEWVTIINGAYLRASVAQPPCSVTYGI